MRSKFITFEGGEGSGKSTQIRLLSEALSDRNISHIVTREPGGTPLAERIRPLLVESQNVAQQGQLDKRDKQVEPALSSAPCERQNVAQRGQLDNEDWCPLAETLLFFAARAQHWQHKILPVLQQGTWVLCDRFMDSTLVYQGIAKQLGLEAVKAWHATILGDVTPDITFLLDLPPEEGLRRAATRGDSENRFESLGLAFHQRLRDGFLQLAQMDAQRIHVIDATQSIDQLHTQLLKQLSL